MDLEISEIDKKPKAWSASKSNKVHAKGNEAESQTPNRSAAIKQKWRGFVESSTLHGLQHVFKSQTALRRIIWALLLLSGIGWFSYQSSKLLAKYYSYPVTTKVTLVYEDAPQFPAITICNFNMFRLSLVKAKGYEDLFTYVLRKARGIDTSNDTVDLSKFDRLNVSKFHFDTGHQIKDTLGDCTWNGEHCSYRNFTAVLTSMGLCHTFNSGKDGQPILKVQQAGTDSGLHLILDVQQYDYGATGFRAGLKILIHHQETPPIVSQLGFAVGPGTSTYAAIHEQRVINLPAPYESNCLDKNETNIPGYSKYTTLACMLTCQTKYVVRKCGCRDVGMPDVGNASVCSPLESIDCVHKEKGNFQKLKGRKCDCPVPCDIVSFKPVLSYAAFPNDQYVVRLNELNTDGNNVSANTLKGIQEYISQNMLELTVYFPELNYHLIEQKPAYDSESLLGEIGGQVGLCVGASLLTVLEFCDVILAIIGIRLGFR
ncbi:hypothetical protein ACROYT_G028070 [Oculina patagonica]